MGTSVIGLTGGEPLLREDLEDIIATIDKRSMPVLFTTGYKLTRTRVKALKKAGLEILKECPSHDENRLPIFYKKMDFSGPAQQQAKTK